MCVLQVNGRLLDAFHQETQVVEAPTHEIGKDTLPLVGLHHSEINAGMKFDERYAHRLSSKLEGLWLAVQGGPVWIWT